MNIISVKDLCFSYPEQALVLDKINLDIPKGQITALIGSNGAGKSTLFLNLNGVLSSQSGQIFVGGKDYSRKPKLLRQKIGLVFQDPNVQLVCPLVFDDIAFGPVNLGWTEVKIREQVRAIAASLKIEDLLTKTVYSLSFGQKKKVAMAGVLVMEPEVLIMDEFSAGLDAMGLESLLACVFKARQEFGLSIILSTHDMDLIPLYCDKVAVLNEGKLLVQGSATDVFAHKDVLTSCGLRLPYIQQLMEQLQSESYIVNKQAATVEEAATCLKQVLKSTSLKK